MRLAAIALQEVAKASGQRQNDLDLLLAAAGDGVEQPVIALPAPLRLLEREPDSSAVIRLAGQAYALQNDSAAWLASRLAAYSFASR
jgi:uncharacterized membrane protein (DUF2068 family)